MGKIISKNDIAEIEQLKNDGKKIILCHGVFDLVHPGHIIHFQEAKRLGDILIVSVTAASYVRKGPGRPYFNDQMRLKFLSAIECIDYVMLSESYTVDDIIKVIKPDLYVKGKEYEKSEDDITGKISEEVELVRKNGGDVYYTSGETFSSTRLINNALPAMSSEVRDYMSGLKESYTFESVKAIVDQFKDLKVLVVGDVIIDEYVYCDIQGLMSKDMGYSTRFVRSEQYLGGSLAVARHIASFSDNTTIMSVIGKEDDIHSRLLNDLSDKMRLNFEYSDSFNTIIKKRYIVENVKRQELNKIFVINNLSNPLTIDEASTSCFKEKLKEKSGEYDLVVLCDFGHGLIDEECIEILKEKSKFLSINCQTNSSNYGFNLITKYKDVDAFALDQKELRLAMRSSSIPDETLLKELSCTLGKKGWLTQGSKGAIGIENGVIKECPALTLQITDTIGAGDAFFAMVSLCALIGVPTDAATFMGNIAGALASNIAGNKDSINKVDFLKYANTLMNI